MISNKVLRVRSECIGVKTSKENLVHEVSARTFDLFVSRSVIYWIDYVANCGV